MDRSRCCDGCGFRTNDWVYSRRPTSPRRPVDLLCRRCASEERIEMAVEQAVSVDEVESGGE